MPLSRFLTPLRIEQVGWKGGRSLWKTLAPLEYDSEIIGDTVVIPAEFITDLASVPRLLLTWWVAGGRAPRSAVVHDYGYQTGTLPLKGGKVISVHRAKLDAVFDEANAADPFSGTGPITRPLMWAGVRAGGWLAWRGSDERAATLNPIWTAEGWPVPTPEAP